MKKTVKDSVIELLLEKDLTANNVESFNKDIELLLKDEDDFVELVLNLSNTKNIDSVGVTFIIGQYKKMQSDGCLFRISGASNDVKSLFKLMKLDQFFELED